MAIAVCLLALSVTRYKMDGNNRATWDNTLKENIFAPGFFYAGFNAAKINRELKLIPPDAKVCASESLLPHLAQRRYIYEFPDVEDAEYMAVFMFKDNYMLTENNYQKALNQYMFNPSWSIMVNDPPFLLLRNTKSKQ